MATRPTAPTTQPRPAHTAQGVRVSDYAVDGAAVLARAWPGGCGCAISGKAAVFTTPPTASSDRTNGTTILI